MSYWLRLVYSLESHGEQEEKQIKAVKIEEEKAHIGKP
jgi:hypothetical protein